MYDIIINIVQFGYTSYMMHLGVCLSSTSSLSSAVKRQFQLQVAKVFPLFSSAPKMKALSEELAHTPLSTEHDSTDMLLSAEDSSAITRQFLKLWSRYEVSLLKLVIGIQLESKALEGLEHFVKTRDDCLQYTSLPDGFPQGPLTADQLAPPPGYAPLQLTLPNCPEALFMGHLWSLKKQLCSALALQPYALLLKGYMEGSTQSSSRSHSASHLTRTKWPPCLWVQSELDRTPTASPEDWGQPRR